MLEVKDVSVNYGGIRVLKDITLKVEDGDLVSIIGANGAGKTTLLRAISGLVVSKAGRIIYGGKDLTNFSSVEIVKEGISMVPEGRRLFADLKVIDNLRLGAYLYYKKRYKKEIEGRLEQVFSIFPRLEGRKAQIAGTLSGGEQQMLAIGRAFMSKAKLLLLDEPSLGIAPLVVLEIFKMITDLHQRGTSILLVEQNARAALRIAKYGYVLETGELVLEGNAKDLFEDQKFVSAFLGV